MTALWLALAAGLGIWAAHRWAEELGREFRPNQPSPFRRAGDAQVERWFLVILVACTTYWGVR